MADFRNITTAVSVAIALVAAGWAYYATQQRSHSSEQPAASALPTRPASPGEAIASTARQPSSERGSVAVIAAIARPERIVSQINALGTARANEAVEITSKVSNTVTVVRFTDGQRVPKGQVLVELDSAQARADLAAAEAASAESASQVKRSRELIQSRVISESQFEQLEATMKANDARVAAARSRVDDTVIRAPFAGRVGLRRVSVGSLVNPGATMTTLDDLSVIKVDFSVPENFLAGLREGLEVTATAAAFPGRRFIGTVTGVDSRIDPVSRSITVRAAVPNADLALKPGMFLNVTLVRDEHQALMVPEAALVPEQSRQFLFVIEEGRATRREVRIGGRQPGRVEIVSGLKAGEQVVVEGTQKVREGGEVRVVERPAPAVPESAT
ncbi:MAG: efflux RND transporter periplasmic adaptor subunit [Gammaproteobacteria bacterium]